MSNIFFMKRVLAALGSGLMFKRVYGILLRIVALITAIGGAVLWVSIWQEISELGSYWYYGSRIVPAGVVVQILMLVLLYCLVHTLLIRARTVEQLQQTNYIIAPIFSVTLKLVGEIFACVLTFSGLAGGISIWIANRDVLRILGISAIPSLGTASFITGFLTILVGLFLAFTSLVTFYYSAELSIVLVDIATNTRVLQRNQVASGEQETSQG
ncbi:MAG: hypothetical protein QM451_09115 [Bacillota bacterium]|nr:hypothetical protein [Bacillota bacterium]HHT89581.1 hypothetical protein [Bacillota bacterium]